LKTDKLYRAALNKLYWFASCGKWCRSLLDTLKYM